MSDLVNSAALSVLVLTCLLIQAIISVGQIPRADEELDNILARGIPEDILQVK